jgi:hypothetical protein
MTEQDERTIYEWAMPELKGTDWHKVHKCSTGLTYAVVRDGSRILGEAVISRQDMNFAFEVCIPRLVSEGVRVMYNNMGSGEWWFDAPDKDAIYTSPDFYSALLAYIKGIH